MKTTNLKFTRIPAIANLFPNRNDSMSKELNVLCNEIHTTLSQYFVIGHAIDIVVVLLTNDNRLYTMPLDGLPAIVERIEHLNKNNPELIERLKALKFEHDLLLSSA